MPVTFLTQQERSSYEKNHLNDETDILQYFFSTPNYKYFLQDFSGPVNRIAVLIQIGLIRLMGYLPANWDIQVNEKIVQFVTQK